MVRIFGAQMSDVSDRATRLLGVTDVTDRLARVLGTTALTDPAGTGPIGTGARNADATTPTLQGLFTLSGSQAYNGATWDRLRNLRGVAGIDKVHGLCVSEQRYQNAIADMFLTDYIFEYSPGAAAQPVKFRIRNPEGSGWAGILLTIEFQCTAARSVSIATLNASGANLANTNTTKASKSCGDPTPYFATSFENIAGGLETRITNKIRCAAGQVYRWDEPIGLPIGSRVTVQFDDAGNLVTDKMSISMSWIEWFLP